MKRALRVAVAGHVDHGKSTVIGRLLSDTGQVREDRFDKVKSMCESSGRRFEFAFLLDALEEEQQQGITIDVTEVPWLHDGREYTIIDTPGHREFLKNMVGGASRADAAVLVVDVLEGLKVQFQRQVAVMGLLGIPKILVVVNKMDLVDWSETEYLRRESEIERLFMQAGLPLPQTVPVGAWAGANIVQGATDVMPWYRGPTLAQALSDLPPAVDRVEVPLRFPLQDVYKFDDKRIYVGRVESGRLRVGDRLRFLPSGRESVVKSIEEFNYPEAEPGDSIGVTLEDPLFLERGELGFHLSSTPRVSRSITADLFWLAPTSLTVGKKFAFRCANSELNAQVEAIESVLDPETLTQKPGNSLEVGSIGRIRLSLDKPLAHDFFKENEATGRFVLIEDYRVAGGGRILSDKRAYLSTELSEVTREERTAKFGHRGLVVWTTGLSGAGKSTLTRQLERRLFSMGVNTYVLDGDNIRQGLCSDLGFSDTERSENIRRVAEVAKLFAESGTVVLTAFLSPFEEDRARARDIIGVDRFVEVFVDCPIEECEKRDPKKLYQRARQGEVTHFTGLSSRYERPQSPDVHLRTDKLQPAEAVDRMMEFLQPILKTCKQ
ncbi:MAG: adenylyl-sulfate kinase [Bdellovibrionales bacterium]|nr:adenylyl-sulfate kinase [Bdellovibrionales bacterium]